MKTVFCVIDNNGCNHRILRKRNWEKEMFFFKQSKLEPQYTLLEKREFETFESTFDYFISKNSIWCNYYFSSIHKDYREHIESKLLPMNNENFMSYMVRMKNSKRNK